jgi:alcohol dehydrogenase (cytochrome c)
VCHGANLQGESGTPLTGATFSQAYGGGTAAQLYDFLSRQMPLDAPGTLTQQQYLDVTAYILSRNGLAAGDAPLTTGSLDQVRLAGMIAGEAAATSNTDEIVRAAPPTRKVYAAPPTGANVNINDSMMLNAASDESNWLLHGRTYDNQRYSPLKQITVDNIKSLNLVALVQTSRRRSLLTR